MSTAPKFPDFYAGDSLSQEFGFKDALGNDLDVTGYDFYLTLKADFGVTDANAALANKYAPTGAAWTLELSAADTAVLAPGVYALEIRMRDPAGNVATLLEQAVTVRDPLLDALT